MNKIKYLLRVLTGVSFKKMFTVINKVHEKSGKNKVLLFFDILLCIPLYGAGYYDYLIFAFYDMNHKQRKTYVTRMKNKRLITALNNKEHSHLFEHKGEFIKLFADFLGREVLDIKDLSFEQFERFIADKDIIFAKPYIGESGAGIEKLHKSDFKTIEDMFHYITDGKFGLVEEFIVQHSALSAVYPHSVNTYRIVTLVTDDGVPHCVYATAKFGGGGKFVDNLDNGGVCCPIDRETGKIEGCGHTSRLVPFDAHPDTKVKLYGYQLPFVKEAVQLALKAALMVDDMRYIGWDVYVNERGPGIVEGNDYPGYDFWQLPEHTPDKTGLWPYYKRMVKNL
ncbi:MAG: carboxylate--amine ligase [Clostridiales bacterium]|nr:carboxylate--amine ligase [Clostridiales bacterium]